METLIFKETISSSPQKSEFAASLYDTRIVRSAEINADGVDTVKYEVFHHNSESKRKFTLVYRFLKQRPEIIVYTMNSIVIYDELLFMEICDLMDWEVRFIKKPKNPYTQWNPENKFAFKRYINYIYTISPSNPVALVIAYGYFFKMCEICMNDENEYKAIRADLVKLYSDCRGVFAVIKETLYIPSNVNRMKERDKDFNSEISGFFKGQKTLNAVLIDYAIKVIEDIKNQ